MRVSQSTFALLEGVKNQHIGEFWTRRSGMPSRKTQRLQSNLPPRPFSTSSFLDRRRRTIFSSILNGLLRASHSFAAREPPRLRFVSPPLSRQRKRLANTLIPWPLLFFHHLCCYNFSFYDSQRIDPHSLSRFDCVV